MNLPDFVNSDWFGAAVMAIVTWTGHKIWDRSSDANKQKLTAAIGEARSIIAHLRETAAPETTTEEFIVWCKGAVAVQLAKVGISTEKNALARAMVNELIADSVTVFASKHGKPPPILTKLKK